MTQRGTNRRGFLIGAGLAAVAGATAFANSHRDNNHGGSEGRGMTLATTKAELMAALQSATGGEVIYLAPGNYDGLRIRNQSYANWPETVTIRAADPDNPPLIAEPIRLTAVQNLAFDNINFLQIPGGRTSAGNTSFFRIEASDRIRFIDCQWDGNHAEVVEHRVGTGIWCHGSKRIMLLRPKMFDLGMGFWAQSRSRFIRILNGEFYRIREDFLRFNSCDDWHVEGNHLHDSAWTPGAGHRDFIQAWSLSGKYDNVKIIGNLITAGEGPSTQAMHMTASGGLCDNMLVEHNVIFNGHHWAIRMPPVTNSVVRHNTILDTPWHSTAAGTPRISFGGGSVDPINEMNIEPKRSGSGVPETNLEVLYDDPTHERSVENLFVNALLQPPDTDYMADLRAVPGGLIEQGGWGAPMTRTGVRHQATGHLRRTNMGLPARRPA